MEVDNTVTFKRLIDAAHDYLCKKSYLDRNRLFLTLEEARRQYFHDNDSPTMDAMWYWIQDGDNYIDKDNRITKRKVCMNVDGRVVMFQMRML
jgi:hypothetical protein